MAINTAGGHPSMDYAQHMRTYKAFLRFTQVGTVCIAALLAGMAYFLVK